MKRMMVLAAGLFLSINVYCQTYTTIILPKPQADGSVSLTQALRDRQSIREYSDRDITIQDLSNLLWAANGFNRPDKRTAATAMNMQEIDVYLCRAEGSYLYDAKENKLTQVGIEDLRPAIGGGQDFVLNAPAVIVIVADLGRVRNDSEQVRLMTAYDAGIVSQNIYLYCAANNIGTVCRASGDKEKIARGLALSPDKVIVHLNHPIGYFK